MDSPDPKQGHRVPPKYLPDGYRLVHPGAPCRGDETGDQGVTKAGTAMTCRISPTGTSRQPHWGATNPRPPRRSRRLAAVQAVTLSSGDLTNQPGTDAAALMQEYAAADEALKAIDAEIEELRNNGNRAGMGPYPEQRSRRVEAAARLIRAIDALPETAKPRYNQAP